MIMADKQMEKEERKAVFPRGSSIMHKMAKKEICLA